MQRKLAASCNPVDTITIDGDKVNISFNGKRKLTRDSHDIDITNHLVFFYFDRRYYSKFTLYSSLLIYGRARPLLGVRTLF